MFILDMLMIDVYTPTMTSLPHPLHKDIGYKVHKLACLMGRAAEQALADDGGLTFSQFRMLMAVHRGRDLTQKRVARFHGLTEAAVSRQIEILREKKLLQTEENADNRRERKLTLTEKGTLLLAKARKTLESTFASPFAKLAAEEKRHLDTYLTTLIAALETTAA